MGEEVSPLNPAQISRPAVSDCVSARFKDVETNKIKSNKIQHYTRLCVGMLVDWNGDTPWHNRSEWAMIYNNEIKQKVSYQGRQ
jgi:hypothetical protein